MVNDNEANCGNSPSSTTLINADAGEAHQEMVPSQELLSPPADSNDISEIKEQAAEIEMSMQLVSPDGSK